ncbi:CPXCG motif-containing cysteine-rich protein [Phormidium yuhuli AB48]|uniref:CPXCG motif-containing cysteine-rich protein n=1 Tax=Phormidium yuhuli AB48 TaxID=2940671 RepID=A0ABY5ANX6_9CYAN|nr:CPXCG motif-containing cysteine-rich protein [Phormidium yuhuli]USR90915.1 CPXCG motif-containing cysteine-rich protein [Phormidium yuhuli AB48]
MQNTATYYCAYCGEENSTFVDWSAGSQQSYLEDCQVCCRPNILYVHFDEDLEEVEINTEPES